MDPKGVLLWALVLLCSTTVLCQEDLPADVDLVESVDTSNKDAEQNLPGENAPDDRPNDDDEPREPETYEKPPVVQSNIETSSNPKNDAVQIINPVSKPKLASRSGQYVVYPSDYGFAKLISNNTIDNTTESILTNTVTNTTPDVISTASATSTTTKKIHTVPPSTTFSSGPDPMTSRIAPPDDRSQVNGNQLYTLTEARLKEIRQYLMYPYYDQGGNADNEGDYQKYVQQSTPQVHKNLNFQLPFFGFRYNYTRVSLNGYLEFSDPPPNYVYPLSFPVKEWPKKNDPAFIGIFFSKCRVGNLRDEDIDRRLPGVYFRLERDLRTRTDQLGVEIRERLKADIKTGVIGSEIFNPKHAIIVTWKNVSFNGGFANALYRTNTFQMVLATDEVYTYAIFNYLNLDWTSHTEAGGDTITGEGGVPAFVGFNAGNGTRSYEYKPYSQESVIRDLSSTGYGNGMKGRHIFRLDEDILTGSCNKDIDGANLRLFFAPESGNMLGGTLVNITGPCFNPTDQIICKFDVADVVYGTVVDRNRAFCIQPQLFVEGWVRLEIAIGPDNFKWKGKYYVESPAHATEKIFFHDMKHHEKSPTEIKITWDKNNLTMNYDSQLTINLYGYRETRIKPEFILITTLEDNVANSGEFSIIPANYKDRNDEFKTDMRFGFIQIKLKDSIKVVNSDGIDTKVEVTPLVWSRPIPLGWYFGPQWERMHGSKWTEYLCDDWLRTDRYLKNFAHELAQCPCTLEQALADKGRFMPDFDCDKDSNPRCYYNNQAIHCVKSGSPTLEGSEQQCCYDRNKYLMLSYDQQWGSSPRRCHNLGNLPYNEATKVPTLSQWYNDMAPKYFCCLWQEEQAVGCETLRFERRPSQDCVAYQAPGVAGVFGDPHIVTFDDRSYTFNGKGEFVLVKTYTETDNLEVQGRFEQMPMNAYGEVRATQLTSVAARGNSSTVIEVRARPHEARWRYRLDVLADGKKIYFDRKSLKFQHFPGVLVYTPTYILNQSEVIIMFDNGAGVEVLENKGYMSARVYLPWSFINKTRGLFGNFSFNMDDEFILPDGDKSVANINPADSRSMYENFGIKWLLDDTVTENLGRSLFYREFGRSASTYNNKSFVPVYERLPAEIIPQNRSVQITKVLEYCKENNYECYYDYSMTLNQDLAHFTNNYKASIFTLKETTRERIISCGVLETPRFGRKSTFLFTPDTKVTYECEEDFVLVGDARRTCLPDGHWDIPYYGYTECLRQQEYSRNQAAKTWGIILAVLVPLVLLIVYLAYRVYKKLLGDENASWKYNEATDKDSITKLGRSFSPQFSDDDVTLRDSERSSLDSKKRRSYDKSYKTNEPLKGVPEVEFDENKVWDLPLPQEPQQTNVQSSPTESSHANVYDQPIQQQQQHSNLSSPKTGPLYEIPNKQRFSSQSSVVTDV